MGIPFVNLYTAKMFMSPLFLFLGIGFALEGLRRAWISGTSLALFIDISSSTPKSCLRDTAALRRYLDADRDIIESVPETAWPLIGPWIDHHNAQECFYEIALELCNQRNFPWADSKSCQEIWEIQP